jgi:hypothetical protein
MARGGKAKGAKRGGSSRFAAQSAEEIEQRNRRLEEFDAKRHQRRADAGCSDAEDSDDDDKDKEKKTTAEGEAEEVGKRVKSMTVKDGADKSNRAPKKPAEEGEKRDPTQMTRREREEAEKVAKAEAYRRRHAAGLTEEYRIDMAKLNEVKARREAAAAKAKMEKEAVEEMEQEHRKKAAKSGAFDEDSDDDDKKKKSKKKSSKSSGPDKLDKITLKKMKPAQLKEALKERNLEIHGNGKELLKRLTDFEAAR